MSRRRRAGLTGAIFCSFLTHSVAMAAHQSPTSPCVSELARAIPERSAAAASGSDFVRTVMALSGDARDQAVAEELLAGNLPDFLRSLTPVTLSGAGRDGRKVEITICAAPDYLAVGGDSDFVRVPMGLPAAASVADRLGFVLPTTRMVDAIYAQAEVRLAPSPMPPTNQMRSTDYLWRHNGTIDRQRTATGRGLDELTAGQKKDLVLSNRLGRTSGRVAIYGWHRANGKPIQPLSTVHGERYADYSHGVRLVSATAFVNGEARPLTAVLQDPQLAPIVSNEGPIDRPGVLLGSLFHGQAGRGATKVAFAAVRK